MTEIRSDSSQSALVNSSGRAHRPRSAKMAGLVAVLGLAALVTLGGCAPVLDPMAEPRRTIGDTEVWRTRTGTLTHTLVAMDGATTSHEVAENSCTYSRPKGGLLPWTQWSNCRGMLDGSQTVTMIEGQIWPLDIGRTWRYRRAGSDEGGNEWDETALCKVLSQRRSNVGAGTYHTYRTICRSKTERIELYVAPTIGRNVLTWHSLRDRSQPPTKQELMRFTP